MHSTMISELLGLVVSINVDFKLLILCKFKYFVFDKLNGKCEIEKDKCFY